MKPAHCVIFFCHGSRNPTWREPFERLLAEYRARHRDSRAELAFLELMEPDLGAAIDRLAGAGETRIRILPLFLAPGAHTREDLPAIVALAARRWPAVQFELRASLAEDPLIRAAMLDWAGAPAAGHAFSQDRAPVLLDSIAELRSPGVRVAGRVVISGSHGGRSAAEYVIGHADRPRLLVFNDAGIGKDRAGLAALALLESRGIACVACRHDSARIGEAADSLEHGVIGHCNPSAQAMGLRAGMRVRELVELPGAEAGQAQAPDN